MLIRRILQQFRNFVEYRTEFGLHAAISLVWQKRRHPEDVRLSLPDIRSLVHCRANTSDFAVLRQVLGRREYDLVLDRAPKFIIDGGANVGYASVFFANRYPGARILAIEPDPGNCDAFRRNCAGYDSVELLEAAIWSSDGEVQIVDQHADNFAFQVTERANREQRLIKAFALDSLIRQSGVDFVDVLKLDIEGAEYEVFTSSSCSWLMQVRTLVVELHERFRPGTVAALDRLISLRKHCVSRSGEYTVVTFSD